jgi:hypothetical protein
MQSPIPREFKIPCGYGISGQLQVGKSPFPAILPFDKPWIAFSLAFGMMQHQRVKAGFAFIMSSSYGIGKSRVSPESAVPAKAGTQEI